MNLGEFGVWQPAYATTPEMAKRIEGLGYTTLWLGGPEPDLSGIDEHISNSVDAVMKKHSGGRQDQNGQPVKQHSPPHVTHAL